VFPEIYLDPSVVYKATVSTGADVLVYTVDPVNDQVISQSVIGALLYPRTASEIAAGVTPVNYFYPEGYLLRYGTNTTPGTTDMTTAFTNALAANYGRTVWLPGQTILTGKLGAFDGSGTSIIGVSKFGTIVKAKGGTTGYVFGFTSAASSTSAFNLVSNLSIDLNSLNIVGIDLSSVGNSHVENVYIKSGAASLGTATGTGIKFDAPISVGAYSNKVSDVTLEFLAKGVVWGIGANHNTVDGGEATGCTVGLDIDPGGAGVDTPRVLNFRCESCATGMKEGAIQGAYFNLRMEAQTVTDVAFSAASVESAWVGGLTAGTGTPVTGIGSVTAIYAMSPDLIGVIWRALSTSRPNSFYGPNVMAPNGDAGSTTNPPGAGSVSMYARGGRVVLDNDQYLLGRDVAGTGVITAVKVDTNNRVNIAADGSGIQLGGALIALGGGAAPTLGTIGGSGPGTAAQNSWRRFFDGSGAAFYVPVWK
jgi:hypothetical protein